MNQPKPERVAVSRRDDRFAEKPVTRIWREQPDPDNPYLAQSCACHGYDILELARKRSFVDVLYLLFRGELPSPGQEQLLERLMIAFINPGPRHPAVRAAMNAGVSRTHAGHFLPISLSILSASSVEACMRFLRKHQRRDPAQIADELYSNAEGKPGEGDWMIAPGFGSHFGSIDPMASQWAGLLLDSDTDVPLLKWGHRFAACLNEYGMGWLSEGVIAAVLADLGFQPRTAIGFHQMLCAPGLLAHGAEMANKPLTAMPFIADESYVIE